MYRPMLKLPKTKYEKIWDYFGGGLFVLSILYIFVMWGKLPEEIPGHFNGAGEVDRWGSKMLWILLVLLEKAPHMHNYPARLNESNVEAFYLNSRKGLNEIKNLCLILFAAISFQMIRIALGKAENIGWWFLPIVLIVIAIPIIKGIVATTKIK
ncbi:DUF1648 domain-containing protein [Lysinibacillus sp. JNUCC 51]|uniref:DUF1648 domain-containing protein n=1 Tax=Lysinibacillus sp. JNUCC-51 TaxID=2792479 RepID=UPI0019354C4B|nr:DUF1648 domain-containing protein [Lysinibacillus sp. JNUCC-51]